MINNKIRVALICALYNEGVSFISDYTCLSYRACMSSIKDSGTFAMTSHMCNVMPG